MPTEKQAELLETAKFPAVTKAARYLAATLTTLSEARTAEKEAREKVLDEMERAGIDFYRAAGMELRLDRERKLKIKLVATSE